METADMKLSNARIEDGKVYGVKVSGYYTIDIGDHGPDLDYDKPPKIKSIVDLDGMPLQLLCEKYAYDRMKVKARSAWLKKKTRFELENEIHGKEYGWAEFCREDGFVDPSAIDVDGMSADQAAELMAKLQAKLTNNNA
jgi:hypothetical protein